MSVSSNYYTSSDIDNFVVDKQYQPHNNGTGQNLSNAFLDLFRSSKEKQERLFDGFVKIDTLLRLSVKHYHQVMNIFRGPKMNGQMVAYFNNLNNNEKNEFKTLLFLCLGAYDEAKKIARTLPDMIKYVKDRKIDNIHVREAKNKCREILSYITYRETFPSVLEEEKGPREPQVDPLFIHRSLARKRGGTPKPVINSQILDEEANKKIALMLEMINNENSNSFVNDEQLKIIDQLIKDKLSKTEAEKEKFYLKDTTGNKSKTQRVSFSSSTKLGGKTKKYKKNKKSRRIKRSRH